MLSRSVHQYDLSTPLTQAYKKRKSWIFFLLLNFVKIDYEKTCAQLNLGQFFYSMSVMKINHYASIQGKTNSLVIALSAIFGKNILLFQIWF